VDYLSRSDSLFEKDMLPIEHYYEGWKERIINRHDTTKPYPIFLVSGEGGGSRAGLWFSQTLLDLDLTTDGKFKDHIFSISTVSGSSVGLAATVSLWRYLQENNKQIDSSWIDFPKQVFKNNFTSSCVYRLTTVDMWKSLVPYADWTKDRNNELQEQEAECVQRYLFEFGNQKSLPGFKLFKTKYDELGNRNNWYLNRDFLDFYYHKMPDGTMRFKTDLPLIFINTCRSSDARRGIFSPVKLDSSVFLDVIDVSRFIYANSLPDGRGKRIDGLKKAISLGLACNTSELFPFLSAPARVDGVGYFVDGGYHENSGLKTTLEVYHKLQSLLDKDKDRIKSNSYQIFVLYLKNGEFDKKYYPGKIEDKIPGLQPISAITNTPFSGSQSYFEEKARTEMKDTGFFRYQLDYKWFLESKTGVEGKKLTSIEQEILEDIKFSSKEDPEEKINYPLARWLSNTISERLIATQKEVYIKDSSALKTIVNRIKEGN
jgi:hypothetical protein